MMMRVTQETRLNDCGQAKAENGWLNWVVASQLALHAKVIAYLFAALCKVIKSKPRLGLNIE